MRLNTWVDVIRVPMLDTNFVSILLLVSVFFRGLFSPTVKLKPIIKAQIPGKLVTSGKMM